MYGCDAVDATASSEVQLGPLVHQKTNNSAMASKQPENVRSQRCNDRVLSNTAFDVLDSASPTTELFKAVVERCSENPFMTQSLHPLTAPLMFIAFTNIA